MTNREIQEKVEHGFELRLVAMLTRECPHLPSNWALTLAQRMAQTGREFVPPHVAIECLPEIVGTDAKGRG